MDLFTCKFVRPAAHGALLAVALLNGCTTQRGAPPKSFTFFPPAPDQPRVQFLAAFSSDADLGRKSTFADYITGRPAGSPALIKPYGLAIRDGKLYVCDTMAGNLQVFDLVKKRARFFTPRGEGRLQTPINITIDADGTRYITDTVRSQVLIFDKTDTWLASLGGPDEIKPADVAVTPDRLYISDLKDHCVKVYSKAERKLLFTIPRDPRAEPGRLFTPSSLALDGQGHLLVVDTGAFRVQVYDVEGQHLRTMGQQGVAPGLFARPKGVAVDRDGNAYVVDAATQVVQVFNPEGKLLLYFGQPGASTDGELYLPAAVKVDYDNINLFNDKVAPGYRLKCLVLVISQFGVNKVNIYGLIEKT